jgi:hypothetical protein
MSKIIRCFGSLFNPTKTSYILGLSKCMLTMLQKTTQSKHTKIQFGSRVLMLTLPNKLYFNVSKKFAKKNLHVNLHNICAFVKFHGKLIFFVIYVKKRKVIL